MRHLAAALCAFGLLGCGSGKKQAAALPPEPAKPYVSLSIREPDRIAMLEAAQLCRDGKFDEAAKLLDRCRLPGEISLSIQAPPGQEAALAKAASEAVDGWNEALAEGVSIVLRTEAPGDLEVSIESSVTEVLPEYTAPACSTLQISSDKSGSGRRKGQLKISLVKPGTNEPHGHASFVHLISRGIGEFLGLARSQRLKELMGPDSHNDGEIRSPGEDDRRNVRNFLAYQRALETSARDRSEPEIEFPLLEIGDFRAETGVLWRGEKKTLSFPVRNSGSEPVELDVKPICGCTIASFDKLLEPGKEGRIEVVFDAAGLEGKIEKPIEVYSNSPNHPTARLTVGAQVEPAFELAPPGMQIVPVNESGPTVYQFKVKPREPGNPAVLAVESQDPSIEGTAKPHRNGGLYYMIELRIGPDAPMGRSHQTIRLRTTSKNEPSLDVNLALDKGIAVIPSACYFGSLSGRERYPLTREVKLLRHGRPFRIRGVDVGDGRLRAKIETRKPGGEYRLRLSYLGGWPPGAVSRIVILETDDPAQPRLEIPVQAFISE